MGKRSSGGKRYDSKPRGPQPIGQVLSELMTRRGFGRVSSVARLHEAWKSAVGEDWAPFTKAGGVSRGKLEIVVANSVLIQELNFRRDELLRRLRELLPDEKINDLKFKVGTV